jgi:hypothetical protein
MPDVDQTTAGTGFADANTAGSTHPEIVALINASESMNDEERGYWMGMLPVMTPEQLDQLRQILQNERDQLAAIDAKYEKQIEEIKEAKRPVEEISNARRAKATERTQKESEARAQEEMAAEQLLEKLD